MPLDRSLTLGILRDRAAVRDVVLCYARAVDRRDLSAVAACFTADAEYRGALSSRGIADALVTLERSLARYDGTLHVMGNQLVELVGDLARCETYAIAHHHGRAGGERRELAVAVIYRDELVRVPARERAGGWLIRKRVARTLWSRDRAVAGAPPRDAGTSGC